MSLARLATRVHKLEQQAPVTTETEVWTPPEFTDEYVQEVLSLLREYGHLEAVAQAWGWNLAGLVGDEGA